MTSSLLQLRPNAYAQGMKVSAVFIAIFYSMLQLFFGLIEKSWNLAALPA